MIVIINVGPFSDCEYRTVSCGVVYTSFSVAVVVFGLPWVSEIESETLNVCGC